MDLTHRACLSITRRKEKSLILFTVIFLLGNVIAGAISIQQSMKNVETNIKRRLGTSATITTDSIKLLDFHNKNPEEELPKSANEDLKVLQAIADLPYVEYFDYSESDSYLVEKIEIYRSEQEESENNGMIYGSMENRLFFAGGNTTDIVDVKKGKIELIEGRSFEKKEVEEGKLVGVISKKLAELNNVSIGDTLVIDRTLKEAQGFGYDSEGNSLDIKGNIISEEDQKDFKIFKKDYPVEIIGLFKVVIKEKKGTRTKEQKEIGSFLEETQYNTVYLPNKAIVEAQKDFSRSLNDKYPDFLDIERYEVKSGEERRYDYQPFYLLKNLEDAKAFKVEATALLTEYDKVLLSSDRYDAVAGPLEGMSKISNTVLYVAVGASLLIVTLIILLFLRDRKHELGIYLALGEKRSKVVGQIVIEVMTVALLALTLSVFTGQLVAEGVSSSLIKTEETAFEDHNPDEMTYQKLSSETVTQNDVFKAYEVKLSPAYIATFYVIGTLTILLSTVVPLVYIMRLNPRKIMM